MVQRLWFDLTTDLRMQQQRAEFRGEEELAIDLGIQQRLFPDPVASDKQFLSALVPNGKREHAAQVPGTICPVLIVRVNYGFGIAVGVEGVAQLLQLFAQLAIVVDFAIENNPGRAVAVVNWLFAAVQVDNGQPAHTQANRTLKVKAVVIRAAMANRIAHLTDEPLVHVITIVSNYAGYATH
jgi:hypothetical protein